MATEINDKVAIKKLRNGLTTATPTTGKDPDANITNSLTSYFNQTLASLRNTGRTLEAIRTLARVHGDVSAAVGALTRLAETELYMQVYDIDHQLSPDGSNLLRSLLNRFNNQFDYTTGFDDRMSLDLVKSSLIRSIPLTGACALELVLDDAGLPYRLQPVSPETLKWKVSKQKLGANSTNKAIPYQTANGEDILLDIPTFFYASLDQDLTSTYSQSPMEPGLNTSFFHAETVDDIRRVVKRSGHSRLVVKLNLKQVISSAPPSVQSDPMLIAEWVENERLKIKKEIENVTPEAALVYFDSMEADYLNSEIGASADYKPLMETIDAILATALKTPAAVVGKRTSGGSQNTSSTESLLYLKTAASPHKPVASVLSRALTLSLRLLGFEGYVVCEFDSIDLRPEAELEAFKSMRQTRILEQLSLGFITDDEAAELLHTGPRAPGAPMLSGTMFTVTSSGAGNGADIPNPNGDPVKRALTPNTPTSAGGKDNQRR